jgi:hypothetical protein
LLWKNIDTPLASQAAIVLGAEAPKVALAAKKNGPRVILIAGWLEKSRLKVEKK